MVHFMDQKLIYLFKMLLAGLWQWNSYNYNSLFIVAVLINVSLMIFFNYRSHQTATIQLDFQLPKRFNLSYMSMCMMDDLP